MAALRRLVEGHGSEIIGSDVWSAYANTMEAAEKGRTHCGGGDRIRTVVAGRPTRTASSHASSDVSWASDHGSCGRGGAGNDGHSYGLR